MFADATQGGSSNSEALDSTVPLFLYFWLPAGKDAFGFRDWTNAPLCTFDEYYDDIYLPIALNLSARCKAMEFSRSGEVFFKFEDDLSEVMSAGLDLRKTQSRFCYKPSEVCKFIGNDNITGKFHLFSSGLYCFRFDIEVSDGYYHMFD